MADLYANLKLPKQRIHVRNAGVFRRLLSFLADLFLLDLAVFGSFATIAAGTDLEAVWAGSVPPALYAATIVMSLLAWAYFALFEWVLGQTPGMMLLKIHAEKIPLWKAFVRHCYFIPLFPFPLLWIIEPLYLLWRKTRWLEQLTKTRTIERYTY